MSLISICVIYYLYPNQHVIYTEYKVKNIVKLSQLHYVDYIFEDRY